MPIIVNDDKFKIKTVKLEVKEFSDKKNTLYVAIALESIKKMGSRNKRSPKALPNNILAHLMSVYVIY